MSGNAPIAATSGRISLIASPIGNLGDITYRAIEHLHLATVIACEDTRHSLRLLSRYEISGKELISCHDHNEKFRAEQLAERALNGEKIALLTDAGTPSVSDPGFRVANACRKLGVPLEVLPGASAVLTGLVGSGLPSDAFHFEGFLPVKSGRKTRALTEALERSATSIFFESPHRISKTIKLLADLEPDREICIARELTKKFEEYIRDTAENVAKAIEERVLKGEVTLLIAGKR